MCTQFNKQRTELISIKPVQNGFLVYINDFGNTGTARPVPFVFETMDNLLEFVKLKFEEDGNQN
jgi:hypothetical protein